MATPDSSTDTHPQTETPTVCDCGHPPTPRPGPHSGGTGYARLLSTGRTLCYPCADKATIEAMRAWKPEDGAFGCYLSEIPSGIAGVKAYQITTWTGGALSRAVAHKVSHTGFPDATGRRPERWHLRVRGVDGRLWLGTSPGPGMYARLRLAKRQD